ncbi:MAG: cytochrome c3 family protein [Planctomycetota bacterium]|jgi:cytochrome c553
MEMHDDLSKMLVVFLILITSSLLSCTPTSESEPANIQAAPGTAVEAETTEGPPPLVVDTSTPLLLDEPTEEEEVPDVATTQAAAENTACFVCHANYRTESLANRHAMADIGCVNCHGQSSAHRNDENNITSPETLYSPDKIDPFCQGCHRAHDVPPQKVVARWAERNPDKTDTGRIVCTDCHGDHRMKVRTVIWDKRSGKLLQTNRAD